MASHPSILIDHPCLAPPGLPQSFHDIDPSPGGHSGGMVVLTVLLSLSVVLLLTAMGLTFLWGHP